MTEDRDPYPISGTPEPFRHSYAPVRARQCREQAAQLTTHARTIEDILPPEPRRTEVDSQFAIIASELLITAQRLTALARRWERIANGEEVAP
jgi:hypothetical protein